MYSACPLACAAVEAGSQDVGKRKRDDDMAALEAAVSASVHTRLPGFVSGGTVQPDQRTQDAPDANGAHDAAAAAPAGACASTAWELGGSPKGFQRCQF